MANQKRCVFSGSVDNLNTSMNVKLSNGEKMEVWISDDFADIATPTKVREAAENQQTTRNDQILELMKKAEELGLTISDNTAPASASNLVDLTPVPIPTRALAAKSADAASADWEPSPGNILIDGKEADEKRSSFAVSGTASALGEAVSGSGNEYSIDSKEEPTEDLREGEKAEIGRVKGRLGMDVAIPVKRRGKTGETRVSIVDTGGDNALQKRFKDMAKLSEGPEGAPAGYQVRTVQCSLCNGDGTTMGKECPKCKGCGLLDIQA